ncbi:MULTISPECIES: ABC transporter substrate-binding protein [unclassified Duganella]|uniref:substrate-binding periplasmic protein n=1 Tax=unclassified Duganella TaxID=2636909 RepID=UPI000E355518|nr:MULTISPECIES: transporter substrate-binding domain-containing protein [unclassified Duganella]RFP15736.1 ABC transporter substrate-binding protein [Duganella sp. BJB475]RFP33099.1 ABC transporter substrate-binding protein [Duganella sp. BJB476]
MKYLLCCLVLACGLASASAETITLGAEDDWAPYSSAVERSARGFAVDVIREAFAAVGVTVNFEVLPYARCLDDTKRGRLVGCFDAVPNAMIGGSFLWHKHPLFTTHMNVYALSDSPESGLTAHQLEGKTVGVERGYEYGDEFDLNTKIVRRIVDKNVQGFRMLLAKRIQYMAAEERIAKALFIKEAAEFGGKFKLVGTVATPGLFIAFSKAGPDGAKYLAQFNRGYTIIRDNGRYKAIEAIWF